MNKLINLGLGHDFNRRAFLSVLAGTALLGLAGCSAGNDGETDGGSAGAAESGDDLLAQIKGRGEMVFATEGNHWREYFKSTAILGWSYLLNSLLLWILVGKMLLNPYAAQALVLSVLTLFNFVLFKHFAFKTQKVHFWEKIYAVFD